MILSVLLSLTPALCTARGMLFRFASPPLQTPPPTAPDPRCAPTRELRIVSLLRAVRACLYPSQHTTYSAYRCTQSTPHLRCCVPSIAHCSRLLPGEAVLFWPAAAIFFSPPSPFILPHTCYYIPLPPLYLPYSTYSALRRCSHSPFALLVAAHLAFSSSPFSHAPVENPPFAWVL